MNTLITISLTVLFLVYMQILKYIISRTKLITLIRKNQIIIRQLLVLTLFLLLVTMFFTLGNVTEYWETAKVYLSDALISVLIVMAIDGRPLSFILGRAQKRNQKDLQDLNDLKQRAENFLEFYSKQERKLG